MNLTENLIGPYRFLANYENEGYIVLPLAWVKDYVTWTFGDFILAGKVNACKVSLRASIAIIRAGFRKRRFTVTNLYLGAR